MDPKQDTKQSWEKVISGNMDTNTIAVKYLTGQLSIPYLTEHKEEFSQDLINKSIVTLINSLQELHIPELRRLLKDSDTLLEVSSSNIPQFSNFASAAIYLPEVLIHSKEALSYRELGYALFLDSKSDGAANKYGENHGNFACLIDLAYKTRKGRHYL